MKKFFSLAFALLLFIGISAPANAAEYHLDSIETHNHESHNHDSHKHDHKSVDISVDKNGEIGINYVPCPVTGAKHRMVARGIGKHTLTSGGTFTGNLYQCSGCLITVTTYYNYFNSGERAKGPGKYVLSSVPFFVGPSGYVFPNKATVSGPASSWLTGIFSGMQFTT